MLINAVFLVVVLGIFFVLPGAMDGYKAFLEGPWWRKPRPQVIRLVAKQIILALGGSAVFTVAIVLSGEVHPATLLDAIGLWLGWLLLGVVFLIFNLPGWLLGAAWYRLTRTNWYARMRTKLKQHLMRMVLSLRQQPHLN